MKKEYSESVLGNYKYSSRMKNSTKVLEDNVEESSQTIEQKDKEEKKWQ